MKKIIIVIITLLALINLATAQKWPGYTLIAPENTTTAYLLDTSGINYHTWTLTGKTTYSAHLIAGGSIVRSVTKAGNSFSGGPVSGQVQIVDYNGNITWDFVYSTTNHCTHHDVCPMPNGNVLLIAYEAKSATEVSAAGSASSITMWPDKIVEVKPTGATTGEIVWEWHAWDHLVQDKDATKANYYSSVSDHPELLNINYKTTKDWMHVNGVDYNEDLDQITFSSHNLNEIYVIDHSTTTAEAASHSGGKYGKGGDFLYRWGNPAAYGQTGTAILNVVHDAHWVPAGCPKAGYLVGFNNKGVSSIKSAVDMVAPPYMEDGSYSRTTGSPFEPTGYTFRHAVNGYTSNEGGSQQLPNGNMIVCVAKSGYVYEIDSNQNIVWSKTITGGVAQAFRYSKCYVEGTLAPKPVITQSGTTLSSTQATTYQWYFNGIKIEGATAQTYEALANGKYQVMTSGSDGCESPMSSSYKYNNGSTGLTDIKLENYSVYPNPASNLVQIELQTNTKIDDITVSDISGKSILMMENINTNSTVINTSSLNAGMYFITIKSGTKLGTFKLIISK